MDAMKKKTFQVQGFNLVSPALACRIYNLPQQWILLWEDKMTESHLTLYVSLLGLLHIYIYDGTMEWEDRSFQEFKNSWTRRGENEDARGSKSKQREVSTHSWRAQSQNLKKALSFSHFFLSITKTDWKICMCSIHSTHILLIQHSQRFSSKVNSIRHHPRETIAASILHPFGKK